MPRRAMYLDGEPAELHCLGCDGRVRGYYPPEPEVGIGWPKHRCPAHRMEPAPFSERTPCDARSVRGWRNWWTER